MVLWIGDLHGYFYTVFQYPFGYAGAGGEKQFIDLWLRYGFAQTPLPLFVFLSAALALHGRYRWLVAGSLLVGIAHCLLPKREFPHYWCNLFPFVALYMGIALQRNFIRASSVRWTIVGAVFFMGMFGAAASLYQAQQSATYDVLETVAETADRTAPPGSTLMVYGSAPIEAVMFLSSLPAANTYWWTRFFEEPYPPLLPKTQDAIFQEYLEHPPGVIVIDQQYLETASKTDHPSNSDRLIRMLANRYRYHIKGRSANFVILVWDGSVAAASPTLPAPTTR